MDIAASILVAVMMASTPLLLAALGELITEKSGVLNLGVEGMMLVGAVCAFAVAHQSGNAYFGVIAGALAGVVLSALFAVLVLVLLTNQVATGLALTLFGLGLSALIGKNLVGQPIPRLPVLSIPGISDLPVIGPLLFGHDLLVYLSLALTFLAHRIITRTRLGLTLRAVGESPQVAHGLGLSVRRVQLMAILTGGALSGLGGAYLSLAYTPMWAENMTSGRGWIALALVVFGTWRPLRVLAGAYLFGAMTLAQLHLQGLGVPIPSQFLSMLPYLATVLVLVLMSRDAVRIKLNAPAALGKSFHPDR